MSNFKVVGLLDRPSRQSLGMLGIIVEHDLISRCVEGVLGLPMGRSLGDRELRSLVDSGDAQLVDGPELEEGRTAHAALWLGGDFKNTAANLGVPLPPLSGMAAGNAKDGEFWIGPTQFVWRVLDCWLIQAFRLSVRHDNAALATLMAWALPGRQETRAAIWHTYPQARKANLAWWVRLDRAQGDADADVSKLGTLCHNMVRDVQSQSVSQVCGICAPAKSGGNEIAADLSRSRRLPWVSFGSWLKEEVAKEGPSTNRRVLQLKGRQVLATRGALRFCLEVLSKLPRECEISNASFVIGGIRHKDVLSTLTALIGTDRFKLVNVWRPDAERRQLLIDEDHIAIAEVEDVMNDATEVEIPEVAQHAVKHYQHRRHEKEQIVQDLAVGVGS